MVRILGKQTKRRRDVESTE